MWYNEAEVIYMSIATRLKEARTRSRLTQAELARMVQVTTSAIGNYETGVSVPKEPVFIALMKALHVDANYFYQDDVPPMAAEVVSLTDIPDVMPVTQEERKLVESYRRAVPLVRMIAGEILSAHPEKK